jgi:hypothetical protein
LENSIPSMSREQQDELLRRSFPFINTGEALSKIPTALLKRRSDIPVEYLNALALNPALADTRSKMPKGVQRQLWASDVGLPSFEAHLAAHLDQYRASLGQRHVAHARASAFKATVVPQDKWRALSRPLKAVVDAIGNRDKLLDAACGLLHKRFAEAPDAEQGVWAAMLFDLLLQYDLVERHLRPQHMEKKLRVARCLDTALRTTGRLDGQNSTELLKALRGLFPAPLPAAASASSSSAGQHSPEWLRRTLEGAWAKVTELDAQGVFSAPVSDAVAPGYSTVVKKPMDLMTMQAKVLAAAYVSVEAFSSDVELMLANCVRFNTKASFFGEYATTVAAKWKVEKAKLLCVKPPPPAPPGAVASAPANSSLLPSLPAGRFPREAAMLLAHPAVSNLLHHALLALLDAGLAARTLPANHSHVPNLLQLLQLAHGAKAWAAANTFALAPPDPAALRLRLPVYQRLLGEVALGAKELTGRDAAATPVDALVADAAWGAFFENPVLRRLLLVACGHAFLRQVNPGGSANGDPARAAALLRVLALHAPTDLATDRAFLDALSAAAAHPRGASRVPEVRTALLEMLESLVRRGGASCAAHACLVSTLAAWTAAAAGAAPWASASDAGAVLRRLAGTSAEGHAEEQPRLAKRPRPSDAPPLRLTAALWRSPEFFAVKAEYMKLKAALPGLDLTFFAV